MWSNIFLAFQKKEAWCRDCMNTFIVILRKVFYLSCEKKPFYFIQFVLTTALFSIGLLLLTRYLLVNEPAKNPSIILFILCYLVAIVIALIVGYIQSIKKVWVWRGIYAIAMQQYLSFIILHLIILMIIKIPFN